jgi:hypothetical protein
MKRLALALALLTAPAIAQDSVPETVLVTGTHSLAGIWQIQFPYGISLTIPGVMGGTRRGHEAFCRMEENKAALSVACLPGFGNGTGKFEKGRLQLSFCCTVVFRYTIDAPIVSATSFLGTYKLRVFGDSHEARIPARGRKLIPAAGTEDAAGQGGALRTELEAIASGATPPPDYITRKRFSPDFGGPGEMSVAALRSLGAITRITYLGVHTPAKPPPGPPQNDPPRRVEDPKQPGKQFDVYVGYGVYEVEFANGQRLCGVHKDESGKTDLLCV